MAPALSRQLLLAVILRAVKRIAVPLRPADPRKKGCNDGSSTGTNGDAVDGSGKVPEDITAAIYTPSTLPASLNPYLLDPRAFGMEYGGSGANWEHLMSSFWLVSVLI